MAAGPALSTAAGLQARLAEMGAPERAAGEKAYLKSELTFVGVRVPDVRREVKAVLRAGFTHDELFALADELWSQPVHEHRLAAIELLHQSPGLLGAADLPWIEAHLRECHTWALVDPLAGWVVGEIVVREPQAALPVLDRWVGDHDFWVRRSAMLGLARSLAKGRELQRCFAYADRLLPEREFFIRKVIGWVLRDLARTHPAEVSAWLRANMVGMNLVTLREPLRRLPDAVELRALYDALGQGRRRNSAG
ncbi:MAG: DNA alkylation repair protein [Pseudomonas sp.]|uniref:DNA alkylation repair protein n=1 Tax=Pseudomonas sp. TaxID=306 RepID=UPI002720F5E4|nr:DNA alkylation repair protein [Pseudomonas sp.]MDO8403124.1 DNA alkylation repair protein [Pseudomonas sp.]